MERAEHAGRLHNASNCLAAHWKRPATRRALAANPNTVAVCVLGQTRFFGLTVFNLYWSLHLRSTPHHLFFVGPADRSWRLHEAFVTAELPSAVFRYKDPVRVVQDEGRPAWWLLNETEGAAMSGAANPVLVLNSASAGGLGMRTSNGRVQQRFVAMLAQLWQQDHCLRMVRAHEAAQGMRFARVVKTRMDAYYYRQMPIPRLRQLVWPTYRTRAQDIFFDAPADVAQVLLDSSALRRGVAAGVDPGGLIHELWHQRLERHRGPPIERVVDCAAAGANAPRWPPRSRSEIGPWCLMGFMRGTPACHGFRLQLESPDPEELGWHRPDRSATGAAVTARSASHGGGLPRLSEVIRGHQLEPWWSEVPVRLRALMLDVARECFGATPSAQPLRNCEEEQGDLGPTPMLDERRSTSGYMLV